MVFWLSAIGLVILTIFGGYLGYGATGALTMASVIGMVLFAIWIVRTA